MVATNRAVVRMVTAAVNGFEERIRDRAHVIRPEERIHVIIL